jgi:hypothetical protein
VQIKQEPTALKGIEGWVRELARESAVEEIALNLQKIEIGDRVAYISEETGLTPSQIRDVKAWVKIDAGRILRTNGIPESVLDLQNFCKLLIAYQACKSPEEFKEKHFPLSAEIPSELIVSMLEDFILSSARKGKTKTVRAAKAVAVAEPEIVKPQTVRGDVVDYQFATKIKYRATWRDFLQRHADKDFFAQALVLCLPSQNPSPEIDCYVSGLGISPGRIYGVEGGRKEVREQFAARAQEIGIHPITARLEEYLPKAPENFSVVHLDFLGQLCGSYSQIIRDLPLKERSFVCVNIRGQRELKGVQGQIIEWNLRSQRSQKYYQAAQKANLGASSLEAATIYEKETEDWEGMTEAQLSDARRETIDSMLLTNLSANRRIINSRYREKLSFLKDPVSAKEKLEEQAGALSVEIFKFLRNFSLPFKWLGKDDGGHLMVYHPYLSMMCLDPVFLSHKVKSLEKFEYFSEVSKGRSHFYSFMAEIVRPSEKEYGRWHESTRFMLASLIEMVKGTTIQLRVEDSSHNSLNNSRMLREDDRLIIRRLDQRFVAAVEVSKLIRDFLSYSRWLEQFRLDLPRNQQELPRTLIKG